MLIWAPKHPENNRFGDRNNASQAKSKQQMMAAAGAMKAGMEILDWNLLSSRRLVSPPRRIIWCEREDSSGQGPAMELGYLPMRVFCPEIEVFIFYLLQKNY